jgi:hypothetical protein
MPSERGTRPSLRRPPPVLPRRGLRLGVGIPDVDSQPPPAIRLPPPGDEVPGCAGGLAPRRLNLERRRPDLVGEITRCDDLLWSERRLRHFHLLSGHSPELLDCLPVRMTPHPGGKTWAPSV